jgi:DNA-binding transcriptional regulator YiaG
MIASVLYYGVAMNQRTERTLHQTGTAERALRIAVVRQMCRDGRLRQVRQGAGLSLTDLAEGVDTTAQTLWKWETGMRSPRAEKALRLFDTLELLRAVGVTR